MAYNVMVSKLSNTSPVIKDYFNQRTSLAMSAYISDEIRRDLENNQPYKGKDSRDLGEVQFTALLFPSDAPERVLQSFNIKNTELNTRIKDRFENSKSLKFGEHYLIKEPYFISKFWTDQDTHIKEISKGKKARLYNLMLFNTPAAKKHFPPEMHVTVDDLRELEEKAIYEICDEFYLKKGLPVEIGRHQKNDIVHYHFMYPTRVLSYMYEQKNEAFGYPAFRAWLSKSKLDSLNDSLKTRKNKEQEWTQKFELNPNDYNKIRMDSWHEKVVTLNQEIEDILDIIAGLKRSGYTYSKYYKIFTENQTKRIQKTLTYESPFASHKGHYENYLDTYEAMDKIKERYAEILNRLLADEGLIKPNTKLYEYSKSLREYITHSESRIWGIPKETVKAYNKILSKPFKIDDEFFNEIFKKPETKKDNKAYKRRKHLIVNALKVVIKESLQRHKRGFVNHPEKVEQWSNVWVNQLKDIKEKYNDFILALLDRSIYNFNWRKVIKQNLVDEVIQQQAQIVIEKNETVNEVSEENFESLKDKLEKEDEVSQEILQEVEIELVTPEEEWERFVNDYQEILDEIYFENIGEGFVEVWFYDQHYSLTVETLMNAVFYVQKTKDPLADYIIDLYEIGSDAIEKYEEEEMER